MGTRLLTLTRLDEVLVVAVVSSLGFAAFGDATGVVNKGGWMLSLSAIAWQLLTLGACLVLVRQSESEKKELLQAGLSYANLAAPAGFAVLAVLVPQLSADTLLNFVLLVLVAPWVEELIYRKLLLRPYLDQGVFWQRAGGAAFLFALVQGAAPFIPAFLLGLFLAWVYRHFRNIAPCMLAHAVFNFAWFCHCQAKLTA